MFLKRKAGVFVTAMTHSFPFRAIVVAATCNSWWLAENNRLSYSYEYPLVFPWRIQFSHRFILFLRWWYRQIRKNMCIQKTAICHVYLEATQTIQRMTNYFFQEKAFEFVSFFLICTCANKKLFKACERQNPQLIGDPIRWKKKMSKSIILMPEFK